MDKELQREIKVFIKKQPKEDQDRLYQWFRKYELVYDIPDKSWWLDISNMPPETRATVFWTKYMQSEKKERYKMLNALDRGKVLWQASVNDGANPSSGYGRIYVWDGVHGYRSRECLTN